MRWNTTRSAATSATRGMNCAALAPVPITATRLPRRSTVSSHRAEWNHGPAKSSMPLMSGIDGRLSCPVAHTSASSRCVSGSRPSDDVSTNHARSLSSHRAPSTSVE